MEFDYNNKVFRGVVNYDEGDFTKETVLHYWQEGNVVWGTCKGGGIVLGHLLAKVEAKGELDMRFQYVNAKGDLRTGKCRIVPELLPDGRYRLFEHWEETCGALRVGTSVAEETGGLNK